MLKKEAVDREEEAIREAVNRLPDNQRKWVYAEAEKAIKDPDTYAVLNYLFLAGLHHFYLGRWGRGLVNLTVFLAGLLCLILGGVLLGILLIVGITVVELYALFRSQTIVQQFNNDIMRELLQTVSEKPSHAPPVSESNADGRETKE